MCRGANFTAFMNPAMVMAQNAQEMAAMMARVQAVQSAAAQMPQAMPPAGQITAQGHSFPCVVCKAPLTYYQQYQ